MGDISLKEYVDQRFTDLDKGVSAALVSAEKAVDKAEKNAEKWRENANEWRGAMTDKDKAFALKTETDRLEGDVKKLQLWEAKLSGMATQEQMYKVQAESNFAKILAVVSLLASIGIAIVTLFIN